MKVVYYIRSLFNVKPVIIDGLLCVAVAMLGFYESSLGKDEAFKYWNEYALYYVRELIGGTMAGLVSLIFFRSKSYSDHLKAKADALANSQAVTTIETNTNETQTIDSSTPIVK